jgi:hypothetical protein
MAWRMTARGLAGVRRDRGPDRRTASPASSRRSFAPPGPSPRTSSLPTRWAPATSDCSRRATQTPLPGSSSSTASTRPGTVRSSRGARLLHQSTHPVLETGRPARTARDRAPSRPRTVSLLGPDFRDMPRAERARYAALLAESPALRVASDELRHGGDSNDVLGGASLRRSAARRNHPRRRVPGCDSGRSLAGESGREGSSIKPRSPRSRRQVRPLGDDRGARCSSTPNPPRVGSSCSAR